LGSFAGQITENAITKIEIEYQGAATEVNSKPLTALALASILRHLFDGVNMVNAPQVAKSRGIAVSETRAPDATDLNTAIKLNVTTEARARSITGTLFAGKEPRVMEIEGVPIEAALTSHMLFIRNEDKPGMIGGLGTLLSGAGQNIADFRLGRVASGGAAVALVALDTAVPDALFEQIKALPQIRQAVRLKF
jgi:D-3-phosphoglycerate dehydrogenase